MVIAMIFIIGCRCNAKSFSLFVKANIKAFNIANILREELKWKQRTAQNEKLMQFPEFHTFLLSAYFEF